MVVYLPSEVKHLYTSLQKLSEKYGLAIGMFGCFWDNV